MIQMPLGEIEQKMTETRDEGEVMSPMPGHGSIQKYAREYDDLPENSRALDEPFAWRRIGEYDLPWEAGGLLLNMCKFLNERQAEIKSRGYKYTAPPPPTFREAIWWWRVHLTDTARTMTISHIWEVTNWIVVRQLNHELLGVPFFLEDIEAYLTFKPWIDGNDEAYESAITDGEIPGVDYFFNYLDGIEGRNDPDNTKIIGRYGLIAIGRPSLESRGRRY